MRTRALPCAAVFLTVLSIASATASAAILHVKPGGSDLYPGTSWALAKATVQAAIDTGSEGDEIWVAAGTYNEHLANRVVGGVAVNVALYGGFAGTETSRSQRNPTTNVTILDGTDSGIVFTIGNLAGPTTRVDGFTIRNGYATGFNSYGGGFHVVGSAPTLVGNLIMGNTADGFGGGILLSGYKTTPPAAHAVISSNTFYFNRSGDGGAGIAIIGSSPEISHNVFALNYTNGTGGAIGCWTMDSAKVCSPTIANNFIYENGTNFVETGARLGGGAIYATSDATDGRPVAFGIGAPLIVNNVIAANGAARSGGGIVLVDSDIEAATVVNNTIFGNNGSGIYWSQTFPTIANNIVAFNTWGLERENEGATQAVVISNDVYGNTVRGTRSDYQGIDDLTGVAGNLSADPRLDDYPTGRWHIEPGSPCRDAGDSSAVPAGWPDLDGQGRILGPAVDIGADESIGTTWQTPIPVIHVRSDGDDGDDGLTWAAAKATLLAGIDAAYNAGAELWVAQGVYAGQFRLPAWIHMYGGFVGTESTRDARNPAANATVIDGGGTPGVVSSSLGGHLVSALDGFTVRNGGVFTGGGYITQGGPGGRGAGIDCNVSSPILANNVVTRNSLGSPYTGDAADGAGIGMYASYATVVASTLFDNEILNPSSYGGAMFITSSMPLVTGNEFHANHAPRGSAIHATNSYPAIVGNTLSDNSGYDLPPLYFGSSTGAVDIELCSDFLFERNTVTDSTAFAGAGLTVQSTFRGRIADNVFRHNTAHDVAGGGGGIGGGAYVEVTASPTGPMTIVGNTFTDNIASDTFLGERGGALAVTTLSAQCVIANNVMAFNSSGIWRHPTAPYYPTLETNDLYNGVGKEYLNLPPGPTDLGYDPSFVDRAAGDLHLAATSECVDAGTGSHVAAGETDRDGATRIQDGDGDGSVIVDIGAYEVSPDSDGDGVPDWLDCAPHDPSSSSAPPEVAGVVVAGRSPTTVAWTSQGTGIRYDVAGGVIGGLRVAGGALDATCLADDAASASWEDPRGGPEAGTGWYYLVRAENECLGTYGSGHGGERLPEADCP